MSIEETEPANNKICDADDPNVKVDPAAATYTLFKVSPKPPVLKFPPLKYKSLELLILSAAPNNREPAVTVVFPI